jgi:hypothetical protein
LNPLLQEIDAQHPLDTNRRTTIARFVSAAPGMHEATTAGSDSNGHTACGGAAMVISSQIEIIERDYRHSSVFVDSLATFRFAGMRKSLETIYRDPTGRPTKDGAAGA